MKARPAVGSTRLSFCPARPECLVERGTLMLEKLHVPVDSPVQRHAHLPDRVNTFGSSIVTS